MIRLRDAKYCNLKLFLMLLVVFGHLIEPKGHWMYRLIYAFHMPAFVTLSGMFSRKSGIAMAKKLFLWYIILQTVAVLLGKTNVLTPYWHFWYLLSNACWLVLGKLLEQFDGRGVLFCAVLIGCLIGYVPCIGRTLSLSRTAVFFPYFWCGRYFSLEILRKKYKIVLCVAAIFAAIGLLLLKIPTSFFYQASAYGEIPYGGLLRLSCYGIGFAISFFLLAFVPNVRFVFTKMGADTLAVYLFHAPIVLALRQCNISIPGCAVASIAIVWIFYKFQQGNRCFCGIRR